MSKFLPHLAALLILTTHCYAQSPKLVDWPNLIDAKKSDEAKKLCLAFVDSSKLSQKVEAQKCLANVALSGHDLIQLQGDDTGGGFIGGSYTPEAIDEALVHLNTALKLAPQDLSIHEGRLHVLEISSRFTEMAKALEESCRLYPGSDALQAWLAYASELNDLRQYNAALDFMEVLDEHYPNEPHVLGNIGAFLDLLKRDSEAIPYLQRASELAPKDPINAWDLARAYDYSNQVKLAEKWYLKGLSLMRDKQQLAQSNCLYAEFLDQKLHDAKRACALEKQNCAAEEHPACNSPAVK